MWRKALRVAGNALFKVGRAEPFRGYISAGPKFTRAKVLLCKHQAQSKIRRKKGVKKTVITGPHLPNLIS